MAPTIVLGFTGNVDPSTHDVLQVVLQYNSSGGITQMLVQADWMHLGSRGLRPTVL